MKMSNRPTVESEETVPWADLDATGDLRDDADVFEDALRAQRQSQDSPPP